MAIINFKIFYEFQKIFPFSHLIVIISGITFTDPTDSSRVNIVPAPFPHNEVNEVPVLERGDKLSVVQPLLVRRYCGWEGLV